MKTNRGQSSDVQGHFGFTLIELLVGIAITLAGGNPNVGWLRQRTSGK
jgi:prepilin-type N-terminal cleavage/methylation domain-containing protein